MTALAPFAEESVFIGRSLRQSLRNPEGLLMAVLLPVLVMLLFTFVFGGALDVGNVDYVNYVVPGIILLCAGFGASSTAVDVATDLETGIMDRFRTMPIRAWAVLTGHVVASLTRNLLATGIVIGVGLLLGFRPTAGPAQWIIAIAVVALWILTITYLFAAIGLAAGSPAAANGYGFILLFLPYVSSAFVPVDTLPDWLRGFAELQPITPVIESVRSLLTGTDPGWMPVAAVAWCAVLMLVAVLLAVVLFRRKAGRR
jgi:ABC-2 type transport system permease protein